MLIRRMLREMLVIEDHIVNRNWMRNAMTIMILLEKECRVRLIMISNCKR